MKTRKLVGVLLLLTCALGAAAFSLYRTFLYRPPDNLTPEQRATAMKAIQAFQGRGK